MNQTTSILLLDDDDVFRETLAREVRRLYPNLRTAASAAEGLTALRTAEPDVMLLDLNLGDADGIELMGRIREEHPSVEIIMVTAFATVDAAVASMRAGAFDFVTKPLKLDALLTSIERAAERRGLKRENAALRHMLRRRADGTLIGASAAMEEVRALVESAASSDAPVLITGPSGSGKEVVARSIHAASPRRGGELITVNCASLQENLLESELFGHEKGAFTGASEQRPGLFETAHNATLFLDEVGELPLALQAKLLRAIQFGEIRRVGGVSTLQVDVRILAATNCDLRAAVREKTFREDLFYRLNVLTVDVPPLCDRPDDVEPIFRHVARQHALAHDFGPDHFAVLRRYAWPGNVREVENFVQRLKIRAAAGLPGPDALLALLDPGETPRAAVRPLADLERDAIEFALEHFDGDRKAAAEALGISLRTLYYRLSRYRKQ